MKKSLIKIVILIMLITLCIATKSFANSYFRVGMQSELCVKNSETLEIPLILDDISFDGIQNGIVSFTCNLDYDENVFEFVEFVPNATEYEVEQDGEIITYDFTKTTYNPESKKINFSIDIYYLKDIESSIDDYTIIGTFKFKVKENVESGDYYMKTINVIGANDEIVIMGTDVVSVVHIDGIEVQDEPIVDEPKIEPDEEPKDDMNLQKPIKISIKQNKEGTKVTIIPDEENGIKIGYLMIDNVKITKNSDGIFEFESQPFSTYDIFVYGANGAFLCNKYVTTTGNDSDDDGNIGDVDTENKGDDENNSGGDTENKGDDENKTPGDEDGKNNGDMNDGNKDQQEPSTNNGNGEDVNKSPQTSDYIYVAIGILTIITCGWMATYIIKVYR